MKYDRVIQFNGDLAKQVIRSILVFWETVTSPLHRCHPDDWFTSKIAATINYKFFLGNPKIDLYHKEISCIATTLRRHREYSSGKRGFKSLKWCYTNRIALAI